MRIDIPLSTTPYYELLFTSQVLYIFIYISVKCDNIHLYLKMISNT